jgi:glycosyltransferase involved in cell wall biosynthesis
MLKAADHVIAQLATVVLVDSPSQRAFLIREGVVEPRKARVLADGSLAGVDTKRFRPDLAARAEVRAKLGIEDSDVLFIFVGRLNRDKGVTELVEAFCRLELSDGPPAWLVFVGADEDGEASRAARAATPSPIFVGESTEPERYLAAADVLCLPSRREGFGLVVIEAASSGVPAIASRIYGITDAVVDGETGCLHEPEDVGDIVRCMQSLRLDPARRKKLGEAARKRVVATFSRARLTAALMNTYRENLR